MQQQQDELSKLRREIQQAYTEKCAADKEKESLVNILQGQCPTYSVVIIMSEKWEMRDIYWYLFS